MKSGEKLYKIYCQSCHMQDGGGVSGMNAPLIGSKYVSGDKEKLISIVLHGSAAFKGDGERPYKNLMPAIPGLTNSEIADVLTYVRNSFNNKAPEITPGDVELARTKIK